jgi:hypothetical protein
VFAKTLNGAGHQQNGYFYALMISAWQIVDLIVMGWLAVC